MATAKKADIKIKSTNFTGDDGKLIYPRAHHDHIDGKPTSYPPTSHNHTISEVEGLQDALSNISNISLFLWNDTMDTVNVLAENGIANLTAPYNSILPSHIFATVEDLASITPETIGLYALITGFRWVSTSSTEYNAAGHKLHKSESFDRSITVNDANRLVIPTFELWDRGQWSVALKITDTGLGTSYWKLVQVDSTNEVKVYESVTRSAVNNEGTVTNVSPGSQISGMSMTIDNRTTTPTIATSISNAANFRTAIGAGTSNLAIGTTASTAKAGNYKPSYGEITGSKPPVNATTNTGTVTNVSSGTQVSGLSLSVDTGSTTPVIKTTIANAVHFRSAIGAAADDDVVKSSGTQNISGLKTFNQTLKLYSSPNNQDVTALRIGDRDSGYGFDIKYLGAGTGNNNLLELWADNETGTPLKSISVDQTGLMAFSKTPTVNGINVSLASHGHTWTQVTGKPTFATVATSGSYANLSNTPSILSVNDGSTGSGTGASFVSGANLKSIIDNVIASKQDNLGFTPENVSNKVTSVRSTGATNTAYVSELGVKNYVESMIGSVYRPAGNWNASTNVPALSASMPANLGKVYRVSVEGTRFGYDWSVGDKITFIEGGAVTKWDNVDDVTTVAGRKGNVVLTKTDVDLGSVQNYSIASETAAKAGSSNALYMTPQRTKQAITQNISNLGNVSASDIIAGTGTADRLVSASAIAQGISNAVNTRVPTSRTVNGKALSSNITLTAADVVAVPTSRTVNGKALTSNITLTAADVGAGTSSLTIGTGSSNAKAGNWKPTYDDITGSKPPLGAQANRSIATQLEAEGGTINTTTMTPLRVKQAIDAERRIVRSISGDITINNTYLNSFVRYNSSAARTVSIPVDSTYNAPIGSEVHIFREGAGDVRINPLTGVTLLSEGNKRRINAIYQMVTLKKIAANRWALIGALKT